MKTLTEFSGTMIRMAAKAEAEAKKSLPKEALAAPVEAAPVPAPAVEAEAAKPAEAAPESAEASAAAAPEGEAAEETAPEAAEETAAEAAEETASEEKPAAVAVEAAESAAAKEIMDKAVSEATGMTGDRLSRLREALHVAGRQAERVRLVRVFSAETEVAGAKKIGEFQYVVDLMPHSMKQTFEQKDDKKRGPRRPSGGGKKGAEGSLEGSFSMESVAQDRRTERGPGGARPGGRGGPGGKPGGGRGGPGGGRPGGRGGKPGGAAKP